MHNILLITSLIIFLIFLITLGYLFNVLRKSIKFSDDEYLRPSKKKLYFFVILNISSCILTYLYTLVFEKHNAIDFLVQLLFLYTPILSLWIHKKRCAKKSLKSNINADVKS